MDFSSALKHIKVGKPVRFGLQTDIMAEDWEIAE